MATVIHVTKTVPVTNDAAEEILGQFDASTLPDSVSSQLERVKRDLRGLPPQREAPIEISETEVVPKPVEVENFEAETAEA